MQALSGPLLLVAPALHAGEARLPTLGSQQQQQPPQPQPQLLLYSHRRHLPLAQLEQIEVVEEPSSSTTLIYAPKLTDFTLISLGLLLLFWFGNYVVPDYIFKNLFGPETGNENGDTSDYKQRVLDALVGGQNSTSPASSSSVEEGTTSVRAQGFGQLPKPGKRKNN